VIERPFLLAFANLLDSVEYVPCKIVEGGNRVYRIGDQTVQLCFACERFASCLTPALAHLAIPETPVVDLTVNLWDGERRDRSQPSIMMSEPSSRSDQPSEYFQSDQVRAVFHPGPHLFSALDYQRRQGIYWIRDMDLLPLAEGGAPLRTLFQWWFTPQGKQLVHGAAVGTSSGGVLLVGRIGSGKSTIALACLNAGFSYVGDDYCLVAHTPQPMLYSLYSSAKIHFTDLERFPRLRPIQSTLPYANADKAVCFLAESFVEQIVPELPLKAMLLPTIRSSGRTRLHEISPAAALLTVGPSTALQLTGDRNLCLPHLREVVRQVPCYRLEVGPEIAEAPALIADLLAYL
jgi:hypothetical protein